MAGLIPDESQSLLDETLVPMDKAPGKIRGKVTFVNSPVKLFSIVFNHAFPLDLSIIKYCFQGCPFCFATANKRSNGDVIGSTENPSNHFFRLLQKANGPGYNEHNIIEWCVRKKYPIIFSNNVDPFLPASEAQYKLGEKVLEACLEHRQPLFIQTKEVYYGERVKQLLIEGKDLFQMYVSLSTLDYETAKKYETIAITPDERLKRMKELSDAGMSVVAALNPYVSDWTPDLRAYFKAVKDAGCSGVFTYPLHLTSRQKRVMPKRFAPFISKADRYDDFNEDCKIMTKVAEDLGIRLYHPRQKGNDGYYKGATIWKMPEQVWPIDAHWIVQAIHKMWLEEKNPLMVSWPIVDRFFSKHPEWNQTFDMATFAGCLWTDNKTFFNVRAVLGKRNSIKNIVRYIWNNPDEQDQFFGFYLDIFRLADSEGEEAGEVDLVLDDNNDVIYVYDPTHTADSSFWDQSDVQCQSKLLVEVE